MSPHPSPSSTNVKIKISKYLRGATSEIISKLDDLEMKLNSYSINSSQNQNKIDISYKSNQKPWDTSQCKKPKPTFKDKHEDDFNSTSSFKKEYSHYENSIIPVEGKYSDIQHFKSVNDDGNYSSKKRGSAVLDPGRPSTKNYKVENPDNQISVMDFKDVYPIDQLPETVFYNVSELIRQHYIDSRKSTSKCKSEFTDICDRDSASYSRHSTKENASHTVEIHSRVWHRGKKDFVPPNTAPVAKTRKGKDLFAGRVYHDGNIIPATILPAEGLAYYSWDDKVFSTNKFEIIEIHHFAWEDEDSAHESPYAFQIGRTTDGIPFYLGRVYIEGRGPWVGRIHRDEKHIFVAFRGNELRIQQPYEVFVTY